MFKDFFFNVGVNFFLRLRKNGAKSGHNILNFWKQNKFLEEKKNKILPNKILYIIFR